jgi:P27 family predicted phage terminase small subunit
MIKGCSFCGGLFEGNAKKKYCSPKCKKNYENSKRGMDKAQPPPNNHRQQVSTLKRPSWLDETAAAYWDKVAPMLVERGHLNILSEDAFAELCDLHSRLIDINRAINASESDRTLLQIDDKTQSLKESGLSDIKRKYSARFMDYCKQFYLTPLSNRGNFGLNKPEEPIKKEADGFDD